MTQTISKTVDKWMEEEGHQRKLALKIIRKYDFWSGMTEEEIEDCRECIRCYLLKDFELLFMKPLPPRENDFWFSNHQEFMESAFNTHDFQKDKKPFDKYGYRIKKVMEQIKDLAILHSCVSQPEGRVNIRARFEVLADNEFRDQLLSLVEKYQQTYDEQKRFELRSKIGKLSRYILECKRIGEQFAPYDGPRYLSTSSPEQEEVFQH